MSNDAMTAAAQKAMRATGLRPDELAKVEGLLGKGRAQELFAAVGGAMDDDGVLSGAAARERMAQVKADPAWFARFERRESAEVQEWARLQKITALHAAAQRGAEAVEGDRGLAAEARAVIGERKADPAWRQRYMAGDKAAVEEFRELTQIAVADQGDTP